MPEKIIQRDVDSDKKNNIGSVPFPFFSSSKVEKIHQEQAIDITLDDAFMKHSVKATLRTLFDSISSFEPNFLDRLLARCENKECPPSNFLENFLIDFWLYSRENNTFDPVVKEVILEMQNGVYSENVGSCKISYPWKGLKC